MPRLRSFLLVLVMLASATAPVRAEPGGDNAQHAQSAFLFANRKDWNNALLHATEAHDAVLLKLVTWEYVLDTDSGASFAEITQFMDRNPGWPEQKRLRIRAELALRGNTVPDHDIIAWFGDDTPLTGVGKIALAEALMRSQLGTQDKITYLIRDAWRNGDFDEPQETQIADTYGKLLRRDDDISRVDRLLWEEKTTAAQRMLKRVPDNERKLFTARLSLQADKKLAPLAVALVPGALKNNPGLMYDRLRYRSRRDDDKGVRELLLAAPSHVPYPEKWWKMREQQIRKAIAEGRYALAKTLLANHAQVDGSEQAEALWLSGWLRCEFLNQPKEAYALFDRMADNVRYAVSKSRAEYWAGRAAEKAGDSETAASRYAAAAAYPASFYGQLAALKINSSAPLRLPANPVASAEAKRAFERRELVQAVRLCATMNQPDLTKKLVAFMAEHADTDVDAMLVADLGKDIGRPSLGVFAAKKAMQRGIVLTGDGYPVPQTPVNLYIERPLVLGVSRQESEFDTQIRSPSGAVGLMQLMLPTAKETARKNGLPFNRDQLTDGNYNMMLGSLYLLRMIKSYDGSYIMAIAAYNAGPGNVRNWAEQFGTPGNAIDNAVNWIEKIPFTETRNYVQRVLENTQVYRHLENGKARLNLAEDLER